MDYRIDFSEAESIGLVALMSTLSDRSTRMRFVDGVFIIDGTAIMRPVSDGTSGIATSGMTHEALFHLLDRYFAEFRAEDAGVLVTVLNTEPLAMVAITNDPDSEFGPSQFGFIVKANEIISSPEVFTSAWPNIVIAGNREYETEQDDSVVVTTENPERAMIFTPLLPDPTEETETVSFLIYGATPKAVMEDFLAATSYIAADPEFLTLELTQSEGALDVVSFQTSEGPAVELRLPLKQAQIASAIMIVAKRLSVLPDARIFYVTEIRDDEEMFIVQRIEADGFLAEPRRVALSFQ